MSSAFLNFQKKKKLPVQLGAHIGTSFVLAEVFVLIHVHQLGASHDAWGRKWPLGILHFGGLLAGQKDANPQVGPQVLGSE